MGSIDDEKTGDELRDEGIARAEAGAPPAWLARAGAAVERLAHRHALFSVDDVWAELDDEYPPERRAMGSVMTGAARAGTIRSTDRTVKSRRPIHHSCPVRVWQSRVLTETDLFPPICPLDYRIDGRVEETCAHGVGHPNEELTIANRSERLPPGLDGLRWGKADGIHGCDGCCSERREIRERQGAAPAAD